MLADLCIQLNRITHHWGLKHEVIVVIWGILHFKLQKCEFGSQNVDSARVRNSRKGAANAQLSELGLVKRRRV